MCKKSFSLIELIFMIVVMGIIASVALPRLMDTRGSATASSIKQDISTITTSIQGYYLVNGKISKISDAVSINSSTWKVENTQIRFLENGNNCVDIKVKNSQLIIVVDPTAGSVCQELSNSGVQSNVFDL